ncbi:MAG: DUF2892 domain-containing protein [Pirellulales bacterium]
MASVAGGLTLLAIGLRPSALPLTRLVTVVSAASMLYRGLTGECQVYRALGIDRSDK